MASNFRPYYPRVQNRPQTAESDDVQRGMMIGSAFGKDIQGLGSALAGGIQEQQQNQVANQLLAQYYPDQAGTTDPNADLSTDLPEDVSPDIGGTGTSDVQGNFQGGTAELKMRQDAAKQALGIQSVQAEIAQRQAAAKLAGTKAAGVSLGGGSSSRWLQGGGDGQGGQSGGQRGRGGKTPAYVAGSGDVENDESTDDFSQIRTDFDNQYGKGAFDQFQAEGGGQEQLDKDGNLIGYSITGPKTKAEPDGKPIASVPVQDASMWMQRVNAARLKAGQQPVEKMIGKDSVYGQPQNPGSTAKSGTAQNPIIAQSTLQVRSLPFGTVIYDPNTKQTYTKQKPTGQ
jgi:hypothetical protein